MILPSLASKRFPEIIETKENFRGERKTFTCHTLLSSLGHVVVLHVAAAAIPVAHLVVPAGTLTFGHFWADRPYNVYHWLTPAGATLGKYFNLAADTRITDAALFWRDLVLDVLVLPGLQPEVLDRHELAADVPAALGEQIEAALQTLQHDLPGLDSQLETQADELWQQVFMQPRDAGGAK